MIMKIAHVLSANEYYPFGIIMPNRDFSAKSYRYGFNGKERDDEGLGGGGSTYDYGFRIYNAQIGRFLSEDPLTSEYSMLTPYQYAANSPISGVDLDGLEYYYAADGNLIGRVGTSTKVRVVSEKNIEDKGFDYFQNIANSPSRTDQSKNTILSFYSQPLTIFLNRIDDVTGGAQVVGYTTDCNATACEQLENEGVTPEGRWQGKTMLVDNALQSQYNDPSSGEYHPQLTEDDAQAVITAYYELSKGNPVLTGVSEVTSSEPNGGVESRNLNVMTEHFVVIVGAGWDDEGFFFNYMDNAPNDANGANTGGNLSNNKFYYDFSTGSLLDDTTPPMSYAGVIRYNVTEVRRNQETDYENDATPSSP